MTKEEEAETQSAMKRAAEAYAKHTIEESSPGRWLLTDGTAGSPPMRGWNTRWAEVVVLAAGTLLVHGDGMDPVLFGHMYDSSAEDIVHTMACTRPDDALMLASVRTAMGRPAAVVLWEDPSQERDISNQMISAWAIIGRLSEVLKGRA